MNVFNVQNLVLNQDVSAPAPVEVPFEDEDLDFKAGAMASPYRYNQIECNNFDCVAPVVVDFKDVTTTILAVFSPYRMTTTSNDQVVVEDLGRFGFTTPTSTLDLVRLNTTGASGSAYSISCGSSDNQYTTSTGSLEIIETAGTVTSTSVIENNMSAANSDGGYLSGTVDKIMVTPQRPWVVCVIHGTYASMAHVTSTVNTLEGKGLFRFNRTF